jgi:hypothetical protein
MIIEDFVDERFTDPEDLAYFFDRERKFKAEDWNASFEVTGYCGVGKGTSVRFLTSPILSHSPPVHMYSPSSVLFSRIISVADDF